MQPAVSLASFRLRYNFGVARWRGKYKKSRATFSGNPAVLVIEDPWFSVPRSLGVWL